VDEAAGFGGGEQGGGTLFDLVAGAEAAAGDDARRVGGEGADVEVGVSRGGGAEDFGELDGEVRIGGLGAEALEARGGVFVSAVTREEVERCAQARGGVVGGGPGGVEDF
jgi:hypothetical protein